MHPTPGAAAQQQRRVRHHAARTDSRAIHGLLMDARLVDRVEAVLPPHRKREFPPLETLAMFVRQCLSADRSCQQALDDAAVKGLLETGKPCSTNTGGYCRARARLPMELVHTLVRQSGRLVSAGAPRGWQWRGRAVRLVDGATVMLPDTEANQAEYPQPPTQQAGLGFPQMRVVGVLCLGSGALLDAATAPCQGKGSGEQTLLRALLEALERGQVLLGDALFGTYFLLCELIERGVDAVFEQLGTRQRATDFTKGEHLGARDHLIVINKPKDRPQWMSKQDYDRAPARLKIRELRAAGKTLITTMLCARTVSKRAVKILYFQRWNVELDLRNIKTTLKMEMLACKSPQMARKELWVYLLAYNLIRLLMARSALFADQHPRRLSFKHAVQIWLSWQQRGADHQDAALGCALLVLVAQRRVGNRPGRVEPRALKRRPKPFPLLTKPRPIAREDIRQNGHPKKPK